MGNMKKQAIALAAVLLSPMAASAQITGGGPAGNCTMATQMMSQAQTPGDRALMQSMMTTHSGMMGMRLTGNTDRDFVAMMIPHHQAAVQMAQAELHYGSDPQIKALATSIVAAQQKEIAQMQAWQASHK